MKIESNPRTNNLQFGQVVESILVKFPVNLEISRSTFCQLFINLELCLIWNFKYLSVTR